MLLQHCLLVVKYQKQSITISIWVFIYRQICHGPTIFSVSAPKPEMGILYRQFSSNVDSLAMKRLYTSLVRPHLEYGVEVWNTYLQKDIAALENVQKFALRVCFKKRSLNLLKLSHPQSLQDRRLFHSLSTLFKIIHNIVYFPPDLLPPFLSSSGLRSNSYF